MDNNQELLREQYFTVSDKTVKISSYLSVLKSYTENKSVYNQEIANIDLILEHVISNLDDMMKIL